MARTAAARALNWSEASTRYQGIVQMILAPGHPHGFDQVLCMVGMIWFQLTEPTVKGLHDFLSGAAS